MVNVKTLIKCCIIVSLLLPMFIGCAFYSPTEMSTLTVISEEPPQGLNLEESEYVKGRNINYDIGIFLFRIIRRNEDFFNVEMVVRNALEKAPDKNMLINAQFRRYGFGIPRIFWIYGISVSGDAVNYEPGEIDQ